MKYIGSKFGIHLNAYLYTYNELLHATLFNYRK